MPEKEYETLRNDDGISRRRMLKRIGAGAAVAWSAPVITSLTSPAFAQTPTCSEPCDFVCGDEPQQCGTSDCESPFCLCEQTTENTCLCAQDAFCDQLRPCETSADCINGGSCVLDTCCGGGVCIRPCGDCGGTASSRRHRRRSRTVSGR